MSMPPALCRSASKVATPTSTVGALRTHPPDPRRTEREIWCERRPGTPPSRIQDQCRGCRLTCATTLNSAGGQSLETRASRRSRKAICDHRAPERNSCTGDCAVARGEAGNGKKLPNEMWAHANAQLLLEREHGRSSWDYRIGNTACGCLLEWSLLGWARTPPIEH